MSAANPIRLTSASVPVRSGKRKRFYSFRRGTCAAIIAGSAIASSGQPADAHGWRHGYYAPQYRYYQRDNGAAGAAVALGIFGAMAGAMIASQGGYGYAPQYYNSPAYSYSPGPCPQWWDGRAWNYSCD